MAAQDTRRFAASLLAVIIGDDVGSLFFWELVDKALAEAATMQFGAMDGTGAFHSYIRCGSGNVPKVLDVVAAIFKSVAENGITEEELRTAKNKVLSALVIPGFQLDIPAAVSGRIGGHQSGKSGDR